MEKIKNPQVLTKEEQELLQNYAKTHSKELKLNEKIALKFVDSKKLTSLNDTASLSIVVLYFCFVSEMVKHNIHNTNTALFTAGLMVVPIILLGGTFHGINAFDNKVKLKQRKLLDRAKQSLVR